MHELSLCRGIFGIVERARGDRSVQTVHLRVGQLRQVVPETLSHCWGLVSEDTSLAGSVLDIDHIPVVLTCRRCSQRTQVREVLMLRCAACDTADVSVETGEEFLITSIDLIPIAEET